MIRCYSKNCNFKYKEDKATMHMQTQKLLKINILFVISNNFRRLCLFGFVTPTFKHKYQCFLILVQSFSACTFSRIYALIVPDTNFHQFENDIHNNKKPRVFAETAVSQRNFFWHVVTGTLHWLASLHCLLYFLAFDWLRSAVLFFLNWTVCLFVKESPIWNYPN